MDKQTNWQSFVSIFKDGNDWNEKTIIGFMAFLVMVLIAGVDVGTGLFGKVLEIKIEIYYSFVGIVLGAFGIDGVQKFAGKKKTEEID